MRAISDNAIFADCENSLRPQTNTLGNEMIHSARVIMRLHS
jgi:hypothetical protein